MDNEKKDRIKGLFIKFLIYNLIYLAMILYVTYGKWLNEGGLLNFIKGIKEILDLNYDPKSFELLFYYILIIALVVAFIAIIYSIIKLVIGIFTLDKTCEKLGQSINNISKRKEKNKKRSMSNSGTFIGMIIFLFVIRFVIAPSATDEYLLSYLSDGKLVTYYIAATYRSLDFPVIFVVFAIIDLIIIFISNSDYESLKNIVKSSK